MGFRLILECTHANAKSINYWFWPFRPFLDTYLPVWLHELTQDYVDRSTDTWADRQVDKEAPTVGVCVCGYNILRANTCMRNVMFVYKQTCIHKHSKHTNIRTYIHTYIHTLQRCIHPCRHASVHEYINTCTHPSIHPSIHP